MHNKEIKHGFILLREEFIEEINAPVRIMEHRKSGARLMHIENDDSNKTFSISFRTPPNDDTGLPHILEHAVLCGSRKYPVKEPFVELAKGSLNTYLNAMTYSDKTVYPIASQNDKDFINLMDVYLDAVFFPNIYENPMILKQEGWNYRLENKVDRIEYQGVVYNEMKGAFSSPEGLLYRKIKESLFPDTTYGFESGGDPDYIPDLSQEDFLDFHRKYYHPSNSYICLYGDGDIDKHLKIINEDYLSKFTRKEIESSIDWQEAFPQTREINLKYPISKDESQKNKTYFALNFVVGNSNDRELVMAMEVLQDLLLETPAAPLKKALIDAGVGQDVFGSYNTSLQQPVFSIVVKNSSEDKKEDFYRIVMDTLNGLVKDGIDKKLIEGAINSKEFELREADFGGYSKGLLYATESLKSWLYDGDPFIHLKYEEELKCLKTSLTTTYLEDIIQLNILDNTHSSLIIMEAQPGLTEEKDLEVEEKLNNFKQSLSNEDIEELTNNTRILHEIQASPDKGENLEKIPMLSLSDLDKDIKYTDYKIYEDSGIPIIFTPQDTNKIAYINMYYDLRGVKEDLIPYIGLLTGMLGKIDSENYSYKELSNLIDIKTGGIKYHTLLVEDYNNPNEYIPNLVIKSKVLYSKVIDLSDLLEEIMFRTKFDQADRIFEIIREMKSRIEMSISSSGHSIALSRLLSSFSQKGYYDDALKGLGFYDFICEIEQNFTSMEDDIIKNLEEAFKVLSNKDRLMIGITSEEAEYDKLKASIINVTNSMNTVQYKKVNPSFELNNKNEGLLAPFNVQYVAKGYNFKKLGYEYSGSMSVLKNILSLDYLWNNVRVKNGAYGCFTDLGRSGMMFYVSYRDPNVRETIDIYDKSADYIKNFNASDRDMVKYIIGTISKLDFPLNAAMQGSRSELLYMSGITKEILQQDRNEILNTKQENIRDLSPVVEACMSQNYICALGNHNKIKENQDLFDYCVEVFK